MSADHTGLMLFKVLLISFLDIKCNFFSDSFDFLQLIINTFMDRMRVMEE